MQLLSSRMDRIKPSGTLAAAETARRLKEQGKKVFDLAEGEPDFPTPLHIRRTAKKFIDEGIIRYTSADGIPALKKAIQGKYAAERGIDIPLDKIIVGSGAKQLIFCAFMASLDEGDEVVSPVPCWVSYRAIAEVFGGKFVPVDTDEKNSF
jgi:aspartate aminotransferase